MRNRSKDKRRVYEGGRVYSSINGLVERQTKQNYVEELAALERVKGGRENEKGGMESEAIDRSVLFSFRAGYSISTTFLSSNGHRVSIRFLPHAFFFLSFF